MRIFPTILILFISFSIHAQKLLETPPGTLRINDSVFMDKGPVDNLMYLEFTNSVQELWSYALHDSLKSLELGNIDRSLGTHSLNENQNKEIYDRVTIAQNLELSKEVDISTYFNHPKYRYHPVIGISKDLAELFCEWRTDLVNLRWSKELKDSQNYKKIKYRLPTLKEYMLAKDYFEKNYKLLEIDERLPLKIDLKELRNQDKFILFNNSEFTSRDQNFREELITSDQANQTEEKYVFFRCICEVEK